jgi:hypothetical protein
MLTLIKNEVYYLDELIVSSFIKVILFFVLRNKVICPHSIVQISNRPVSIHILYFKLSIFPFLSTKN